MTALHSLHEFILAPLIVVSLTGLALLVARVAHRLIPASARTTEAMDLTFRVMPALVSMAGFVLAISIVQARGEIARIERAVATEAATILDLDRTMRRYDTGITAEQRALLRAYAVSVVEEAWPAMQRDTRSASHEATYERFVQSIRHLTPDTPRMTELYASIERDLDTLETLRNDRMHDADVAVPALFWSLILGLHVAIMALGGMFRPTVLSMVLIATQNAALAALIAFLFVHDRPFLGDSAVSSEPLQRAIMRMQT